MSKSAGAKPALSHEIQNKPLSFFKPATYNPRKPLKPGDPEFESLKNSIEKFGHVQLLVANKNGTLIGGHQTLAVLKHLNRSSAHCVILDLKPDAERALNLGLNKIQGEWDFPKLKEMFEEFHLDAALIEATGFSALEVKQIMDWKIDITTHDNLEKTPDEQLGVYQEGLIKQIVLYFDSKEYPLVIKRLEAIRKAEKVEDNSTVLVRLLKFYENNSKASKNGHIKTSR